MGEKREAPRRKRAIALKEKEKQTKI